MFSTLCDNCIHRDSKGCLIYGDKSVTKYGICNAYVSKRSKVDEMMDEYSKKLEDIIDNQVNEYRKKELVAEFIRLSAVALTWYVVGKRKGIKMGYQKGLEAGKTIGESSILRDIVLKIHKR